MAIKVTCDRCRSDYDIDEAKIPAGGFKMTCPACSNQITVPAVAPPVDKPAVREIALSSLDDDEPAPPKPVAPRSPAGAPAKPATPPVPAAAPPVAMDSIALADDLDFSSLPAAPAAPRSTPSVALAADDEAELPVPVRREVPQAAAPSPKTAARPDEIDLPAPRAAGSPIAPAKTAPDGGVDLPTPRVAPPAVPRPGAPPPAPSGLDFPRPKTPAPARPVPSPAAPPAGPPADLAHLDIPLDLDAPDVDDGPASLAGETDLLAPVEDREVGGLAPKAEAGDELAPRGEVESGLAFKSGGQPVVVPEASAGDLSAMLEGDSDDAALVPRDRPKSSGRRGLWFAVAGAVALLAGGGVMYALDPLGWFGGRAAGGEAKGGKEAKIAAARRAIAEGSATTLRRAITDLRPFTQGEQIDETASLIEAQAHFLLACLGVQGEVEKGKALLDRPAVEPLVAERGRAEGLRQIALGDVAGAKKTLQDLLAQAPLDASALTDLGSAELLGGNPVAAAQAYTQALSAEATRVAAAYGVGLAKERSGDDKGADDTWGKLLGAHPEHVRAAFGKQRILARGGDAQAGAKIEALMAAQAAQLTPRERAEGQMSLGLIAAAAGQRDQAEDWFKKAIASDADPAKSLVARDAKLGLARLRVENGHGAEALEDLRKLLALEPKNVDVLLVLAEALIEKQEQSAAEPLLKTVQELQPTSPRLSYLRGRMLSSRTTAGKTEREQAVALFRAATTADPKLVPAWAALAVTLKDLDRTTEAVDTLGKATEALSADNRAVTVLGAAYLAIGRPVDAEQRFRKVLEAKAQASVTERLPLWLGLGEALEAQDKLDDAMKIYDEAQAADAKSMVIMERRARLASRQNKPDLAKKLFDEALAMPSPSNALRVGAADAAIKASRFTEARRLLEAVLKEDDRSALGSLLMARVEEAEGHPEDAMALARRASMLRDLPEAHLLMARLFERANKLEPAAAEYIAARRPPTEEPALLGHARILVRMGATRDAMAELTPLAKAGGVRAEASLLLGDCLSDMQQADKARHAYEDAVKLQPQLGEASFKLGRTLLDAGKRQPGMVALEHAVGNAPPGVTWLADAYLLLGDAHRAAHESDAAVRAYKKYLELAPATAPMRSEAERQVSVLGGSAAP